VKFPNVERCEIFMKDVQPSPEKLETEQAALLSGVVHNSATCIARTS
jgi:hypothetical protein